MSIANEVGALEGTFFFLIYANKITKNDEYFQFSQAFGRSGRQLVRLVLLVRLVHLAWRPTSATSAAIVPRLGAPLAWRLP